MAQNRIKVEEENRKLVQEKRIIATDSLQKFQLQVLKLDNNNDVAGELGPLQYLSSLTGYSMDKIINILLLIIIFVFDPLAISLVIASNFAFEKAYPKKEYKENLYGEEVEDLSPRDISKIVKENENPSLPNKVLWEAAERRMEIIGQNGNEGEHYSEYDLNKDGVIDNNEKIVLKEKIKDIQDKIGGNIRQYPEKYKELQKLEKDLNDLTIKY